VGLGRLWLSDRQRGTKTPAAQRLLHRGPSGWSAGGRRPCRPGWEGSPGPKPHDLSAPLPHCPTASLPHCLTAQSVPGGRPGGQDPRGLSSPPLPEPPGVLPPGPTSDRLADRMEISTTGEDTGRFRASLPQDRSATSPSASTSRSGRRVLDLGGRLHRRRFFRVLRYDDNEIVGTHHAVLLPGQALEGRRVTAEALDSSHELLVLGSGLSNLFLQGLLSLSSRRQIPIATQGCQSQEQQQRADYESQQSGKGPWRLGCHDADQRALLGKAALPG